MNLFDLTGKVAVVTGGNGGLGLGMALGLARAGASIAVAARNEDKARPALEAIEAVGEAAGARALFVATDVADRQSCLSMADHVAAAFGRIDILVANAGLAGVGRPEKLTEEAWRHVLDVNLSGSFFSAQAVHPHMVAVGGGKIILLGSMTSIFGHGAAPHYSASKGGVVQLAKSLAIAWARDGIQVNAVLPGWFVTDIVAEAKAASPEFDASIVARTPARRWGEPRDLEGAAVFLASPASDFVTGTAIPVDGGYAIM